jgi:hypothetical protein
MIVGIVRPDAPAFKSTHEPQQVWRCEKKFLVTMPYKSLFPATEKRQLDFVELCSQKTATLSGGVMRTLRTQLFCFALRLLYDYVGTPFSLC